MMMKLFVIAITTFATATAFAPNSVTHSTTTTTTASSSTRPTSRLYQKASFQYEVGAQPPLGFFDPLGLVADGDQEQFDRLRYVEIKHGRIAMLAVVGYLVTQADIRWPLSIDSSDTTFEVIPSGFWAFRVLPFSITLQIILTIGFLGKSGDEFSCADETMILTCIWLFSSFLEIFVMKDVVGGEFPGDFRNGFIDFGWDSFDETTKFVKRSIEINQGRAAM